ncbi:LPS export ABC transporter periplasmic protein LptC [Phaeobacter sp. B1627]|uniref:LPS export ABC transporter periplasmic protein LptC n=1 Tax=Phaeobacter sp. B1627 TaxID=2583809 RepID=UPI0011188D39|nr:LPS export ABC transporter periplasmic protein LptC [Phaeobacter sp. B1627]TNJ45606.1 LPS export ABC transporter periplasmic protein LptC [Phaeobacter sp. B1627]
MDRYSRIIALLKVVLPLAAVALLSTLFLISRQVETRPVIPFAQVDIDDRLRGQQVTAPFFTGTTEAGHEITIAAAKAFPSSDLGTASATDLEAEIRTTEGRSILLLSDSGALQPDTNSATLTGNVRILTTDGTRIETETLEAELSGSEARSPGSITATGPIGDFTAGSMRIFTKSKNAPVHIEFTNGVKLVYDPAKAER